MIVTPERLTAVWGQVTHHYHRNLRLRSTWINRLDVVNMGGLGRHPRCFLVRPTEKDHKKDQLWPDCHTMATFLEDFSSPFLFRIFL